MRLGMDSFGALMLLALAPTTFAQVPSFGHVFIVVEENASYSEVVGQPAMPYLNSLANTYGLATNFYANTHPSIGNYFMLTTGQEVTNQDEFIGVVDVDNIVRELVRAGKTWKCYAESLPSVGYTGGDAFPYLKHHDPISYLSDVVNSSVQIQNHVPFSQFANDFAGANLPAYSFIVPNAFDDAHSCPAGMTTCTDADKLTAADNWLKTNIGPLVNSATFQADGLLVIVFDESDITDTTNGGGHVAAVIVSPKIKSTAYKGRDLYQHQDVVRLMAAGLGLTKFPGSSTYVSDMAQFFGNPTFACPVKSGSAPVVSICAPSNGATLTSSMRLFVGILMNHPIASIQLVVDGVMTVLPAADRVDKQLTLTQGSHLLTVQATDSTNVSTSSSITVNIVPK